MTFCLTSKLTLFIPICNPYKCYQTISRSVSFVINCRILWNLCKDRQKQILQAIHFTHFPKKVTFSDYFATFTSLKVSKIILSPVHFLQINLYMLAMLTHKLGTSLNVFLLPSQLYFHWVFSAGWTLLYLY